MHKTNYPYTPFGPVVIRTPRYPFSKIWEREMYSDTFLEDIYVASSDLYSELIRERERGGTSSKMERTIYKYWSRACTRSTPFGLFSCCSVGQIEDGNTRIEVSTPDKIVRITKLDTSYLCSLVQYLETLPIIRSQVLFFPNDSLYQVGERIRYVEYYYKKTRRLHQIQEIDSCLEIHSLLDLARTGKTIKQLSNALVSPQVSLPDAEEFVISLIENQILKSELEVNITGEDPLSRIIGILSKMEETTVIVDTLCRIQSILTVLDKDLCHNSEHYLDLRKELELFPIEYDYKYLLQTNSFRPCQVSRFSKRSVIDIQAALGFLQKLHQNKTSSSLQSFISAVSERYNQEAISLLEVLDGDIGIGYPIDTPKNINNPLLKDYPIGSLQKRESQIILNKEESLILKKFTELSINGFPEEIILGDEDLNEADHPDNSKYFETIPVLCHIMGKNLYLQAVGGASAALILGRFHYLDSSIYTLLEDICTQEQRSFPDDTIALEIVHLPESRIGNITTRPCVRNAEVHYLARSGAIPEKSIPVSDLMIQIVNGKIELFSKSLHKKVFPLLSNAHNYSFGTPVYRFLCDYQYAYNKTIFPLKLDKLLSVMKYIPRIRYGNVILHMRSWILESHTVFGDKKSKTENAYMNIENWVIKHSIPNTIILKEEDNTLLLYLNQRICIDILIEKVKRYRSVILEETMFPDKKVFPVTDGQNSYCAEIFIPFFKSN